jgi:hypothetical protein
MDRILVYPIDPFDDDDHIAGSELYKPKLTKLKDLQEGYRAVLISAGLTAMDRLMSPRLRARRYRSDEQERPLRRAAVSKSPRSATSSFW